MNLVETKPPAAGSRVFRGFGFVQVSGSRLRATVLGLGLFLQLLPQILFARWLGPKRL